MENVDSMSQYTNINIRFKNLTNIIPLKNLNSDYVGSFVSYEGIIEKIKEPLPQIKSAVFECRGCMRLHEIEQTSGDHIIEPALCSECGGRSFRLLQEESRYINT